MLRYRFSRRFKLATTNAFEAQEDVQDYFVRHAARFNGLYGGDNMATRLFDRMFRNSMYTRYRLTLEALAASKGNRFLDLGCGSGRYAVNAAREGVEITGLDFSDEMLRLANLYAVQEGQTKRVKFIKTDINAWMASTTEHFAASYAMGVFDYLTNPVETLRLMLNVSDFAYASLPAPTFPRSQLRRWRYARQDCPVFFFKRGDVEKLVADAGGKITRLEDLDGNGFWIEAAKV
jgi:SAM-dependent methyltransferase